MKPKLKTCDGCKKPRPIWKSRGGKKLCKFCAGVDIIPKPTVKKKPISPRSSKKVKLDNEYSKKRKIFMIENPLCLVNLPDRCMRISTDIHHRKGRGIYLLDESTWLACCRSCHQFIEEHPEIAKTMGWSESRLTNTKNMGELSKGGLTIKEINLEELVEDVKDMGAEMLTGFIDGKEAVSSFSKPIAPSSSGVNLIVRDFHNLYYNEGSSDKVYNIQLAEVSGSDPLLAVVNFAYGRRGTAYTTGTKTPKPIAADKARTIYNKLLKEKLGKGYNIDLKSDGSGVSTGGPSTKESVGFLPQLLNDCSEEDVERLINDHSYCMQEKYDGENRMIIQYKGQDAFGGNKKGEKTTLTDQVIDAAKYAALGWRFVLNGEDMGSHIMIFDYIPSDDNMSNKPYIDRYKMLSDNFNFDDRVLRLAPTAWSTEEKRAMFEDIKSRNGEGVVFKKILALHAQGRPSSGGPQLKFKFYATASVIVSGINEGKRSVEVSVINYDGGILPVGNVTVYPNQEIPEVNSVIEVRYLYWYPGGSLYQPVFLKVRNDVDMAECFIGQLKAKAETPE